MHKFFYNGIQIGNYEELDDMLHSFAETVKYVPYENYTLTVKKEHNYCETYLVLRLDEKL